MKTYAMTINNLVIGVLPNRETVPSWPPDISGNVVIAIECGESVELGMMYNPETNTFAFPEPEEPEPPEEPQPTQLDTITETQLIIMEAMAEQYEESLERDITNMEVQATIYEAILELGGVE